MWLSLAASLTSGLTVTVVGLQTIWGGICEQSRTHRRLCARRLDGIRPLRTKTSQLHRARRAMAIAISAPGISDHKGIAQIGRRVHCPPMDYKGVRYMIRTCVERQKWSIGIHPRDADARRKDGQRHPRRGGKSF